MNVKSSWIPKILKVNAIVLYPFIFFADPDPGPTLLNHEMIHMHQIKKLGPIKFYFLYLQEYFNNRYKKMGHDEAYRMISFEREAYQHEQDLSYIKKAYNNFRV